jgi:probable HAF family extracellular repeat protein
MTVLPMIGGDSAEARAINPGGEIVGAGETATGETHATLWTRK